MSALLASLCGLALLRLGELAYAQRNTRRLLRRGAHEVGASHYPALVGLHTAWLLAMGLSIPSDRPPHVWLLALFALLQAGRLWVIASLGPYWTTRVITLPDQPLIRRGPYRYLRHPNYLIVAAEIAVLPLAFGAWRLALYFSVLNAALLAWRIRCENRVLAPRRALS